MKTILLFALFLLTLQCSSENIKDTIVGALPPQDSTSGGDIGGGGNGGNGGGGQEYIITDRSGMRWDVTHAFQKYGMEPNRFQFGLGPNAIPPINNPEFHAPGDPGFPAPNSNFVIGVDLNQSVRAYPIFILKNHEIVNEVFGDAHVSVAY